MDMTVVGCESDRNLRWVTAAEVSNDAVKVSLASEHEAIVDIAAKNKNTVSVGCVKIIKFA